VTVRVAERSPATDAPVVEGRADEQRSSLSKAILSRTVFWVFGVEVVLIVVFGFVSPGHVFWTAGSFRDLAVDGAEIVPLAAAVAFLLGAGELDISLGANIILSSVLGGRVMGAITMGSTSILEQGTYKHVPLGILVGLLVCCLTGATVGAVNGLVVTRLRVNSFITTLGTLGIATGIADIVSNGADLANIPNALQLEFGVRALGGVIPYPALLGAFLVCAFWALLTFTRFGLHTLSLGSSREAARRAGLKVDRHIMFLFVGVGTFAGLVGFIDLSRFATTNIGGHQTDALEAIAGAVIGGTSMFGGKVSIFGAVIGAMLAVILNAGLVIVGVQAFYQLIAVGVVLILAVFVDQRRQRIG
jgi:ribose transport system permease protein